MSTPTTERIPTPPPTDRIITPTPVPDAQVWAEFDAYLDGLDARHARDIEFARRDATARALAHLAAEFGDRAHAVPGGPRAAGLRAAALDALALRDRVLAATDGVL